MPEFSPSQMFEDLVNIADNHELPLDVFNEAKDLYWKIVDGNVPIEEYHLFEPLVNELKTKVNKHFRYKKTPLGPNTTLYRGSKEGVKSLAFKDLNASSDRVLEINDKGVYKLIADLAEAGNLRAKATRVVSGLGEARLPADAGYTFQEDQLRKILGDKYDAIYFNPGYRSSELFDLRDGKFYTPSPGTAKTYVDQAETRLYKRQKWFKNLLYANMSVEGLLVDTRFTPEIMDDMVSVFDTHPIEAKEPGGLEKQDRAKSRLVRQNVIEIPMRKPGERFIPQPIPAFDMPVAQPSGRDRQILQKAAKSLGVELPKRISKKLLGLLAVAAVPFLDEEDDQFAAAGMGFFDFLRDEYDELKGMTDEHIQDKIKENTDFLDELKEKRTPTVPDPPPIPGAGGPPDVPPDDPPRRIWGGPDWAGREGEFISQIEHEIESGKRFNLFTGELEDLTFDEVDQLRETLPEGHRLKVEKPVEIKLTPGLPDEPPRRGSLRTGFEAPRAVHQGVLKPEDIPLTEDYADLPDIQEAGEGISEIRDRREPKTVGHVIKTEGRTPKKTTFVKVFEVVRGRKPTKAEFKELVLTWKSLDNRDLTDTREIVEAFIQDADPASKKAAEQLDMALLVEEYDLAENERIAAEKKSRTKITTGRETETTKKIAELQEELARTEATKATMSGRGENVRLADTNIKRIKERIKRLLKSERGAVEIPPWLRGNWTDVQELASGELVEGTPFPRVTEEDVMEVKAEDARRTPRPRDLGTVSGYPLTPKEIRRVKEQERIIQNAKDAKRRELEYNRNIANQEAAIREADVKRAGEAAQAQRSTRALSTIGNVGEYSRPPRGAGIMDPLLDQLSLDRQARIRLAEEAAANIDPDRVEWIAGGPDDPPLWWRNEQAREAEALRRRSELKVIPGGKGFSADDIMRKINPSARRRLLALSLKSGLPIGWELFDLFDAIADPASREGLESLGSLVTGSGLQRGDAPLSNTEIEAIEGILGHAPRPMQTEEELQAGKSWKESEWLSGAERTGKIVTTGSGMVQHRIKPQRLAKYKEYMLGDHRWDSRKKEWVPKQRGGTPFERRVWSNIRQSLGAPPEAVVEMGPEEEMTFETEEGQSALELLGIESGSWEEPIEMEPMEIEAETPKAPTVSPAWEETLL